MAWNIRVTDSMVPKAWRWPRSTASATSTSAARMANTTSVVVAPHPVHGSVGIVHADGHLAVVHGHQHGLVVEDDSARR